MDTIPRNIYVIILYYNPIWAFNNIQEAILLDDENKIRSKMYDLLDCARLMAYE